jgi:glycosyltransferase involved in cell wall biosynthesis
MNKEVFPVSTNPSLSGVIILTQDHLVHLPKILGDLLVQTEPFAEIIIVASGLDEGARNRVTAETKKVLSVQVVTKFVDLGSAGKNRNIGLETVSPCSTLVLFHDADDRYPPHRNATIVREFIRKPFDALVHLYVLASEIDAETALGNLSKSISVGAIERIETTELYESTFPGGARDRDAELLGVANSTLYPPKPQHNLPIHHAHVCIQNSSIGKLRYHERFFPRNEDSLFLRDMLFAELNVGVLLSPLSIWVQGASSFAPYSRIRKTIHNVKKNCFRAKSAFISAIHNLRS